MYLDESPQRHSSQRGSDIHIVEAQAYCLPMKLASLLKVTFGLVLLVSQSLTQQALHLEPTARGGKPYNLSEPFGAISEVPYVILNHSPGF